MDSLDLAMVATFVVATMLAFLVASFEIE